MPRFRRKNLEWPKALKLKHTLALVGRMLKRVQENKQRKKVRGSHCWEWQGYQDQNGYGQIKVEGSMRWVHRVFFVIFRRPLKDGETVDHYCCNSSCCNPAHLRPLTHIQNSADGLNKQHGKPNLIPFTDQF